MGVAVVIVPAGNDTLSNNEFAALVTSGGPNVPASTNGTFTVGGRRPWWRGIPDATP